MRRKQLVGWLICVFCAFYTIRKIISQTNVNDVITQNITKQTGDVKLGARPLKRILYWNKYFKSNEFKFGLGQEPFVTNNCEVDSCTTTNDRGTLRDADAIVFHGPQIDDLPDVREARHIYVYVQKEPWMDMSERLMGSYNDVMNVTMTYRRDSDIVLPYATVEKMENETNLNTRIVHVDPKSKPKSVVWVVSHCETDSKRELYVNELNKYIDVDIYGKCGKLECDKQKNRACWNNFDRDYRFVLALENDICTDYVTEKAYRPFAYNLIPIVLGGANYDDVTPPHSVIDIRDYPKPKDLAKYLKYLTNNQQAYNEYFKWKHRGYRIETYRRTIIGQSFCKLCRLLHENYKFKRYSDLRQWWVDGACDRTLMDEFKLNVQ